jgi:hypothetical protein
MGAVSRDDTRPIDIRDLPVENSDAPWQVESEIPWSFGPRRPPLYLPDEPVEPARLESPNRNSNGQGGTMGPQRVKAPAFSPTAPPVHRFGKKAWQAVAQWEGVVNQVDAEGFGLSLTPLINGQPDFTRREIMDFGFDELAYEMDRGLIRPGVSVYWTVGRRKDEGGMLTNQSLVRVKRETRPSEARLRQAAKEAARFVAEAREQNE